MENKFQNSWKTIKVTKDTVSNLKISDENKQKIFDVFKGREDFKCDLVHLFEILHDCGGGLNFAMMVFSAFVKDGIINIDDF